MHVEFYPRGRRVVGGGWRFRLFYIFSLINPSRAGQNPTSFYIGECGQS